MINIPNIEADFDFGYPGSSAGHAFFNSRAVRADLAGTLPGAGFLDGVGSMLAGFGLQQFDTGNNTSHIAFLNKVIRTTTTVENQDPISRWGGGYLFRSPEGEVRAFQTRKEGLEFVGRNPHIGNRLAASFGLGRGVAGGMGLFGLAFTAGDAISGFSEGGLGGAALSVGQGMAYQKVFSMAFKNPYVGVVGAFAIGTGLAAATVLTDREKGNRYLTQSRQMNMGGYSNPVFQTRAAHTMRQRAIQSMEMSRFGGMRALGNEASQMSMSRSRYANSTGALHPNPILGY